MLSRQRARARTQQTSLYEAVGLSDLVDCQATGAHDFIRHVLRPQVERCWAVSAVGTVVELRASLEGVPPAPSTFTPAANDRTHTTRATAVADRRMRPMQEARSEPIPTVTLDPKDQAPP